MSKTTRFICAAVTGFCIAGTHAQAVTTIVDAGGFESYALGDLAGQPGGAGSWREASFAPVGPQSTAVVQDLVDHPYPSGGTKAVKVDRKANDDAYWAVPVSSYPLPNNDLIIIEWDMKVEPANVVDGFGPLFGIQAFDGAASPLLLGSVGVDANTGEILYQETITGILTPIEPSLGILVDDQWHQYRMAIDYTNRAYQVVYDGQLILTEPIVDSAAVGFTDADIAAIAANIDANSQNAEGTAYFDNFIVVNFDRLPGDYDIDGDVDANDYAVWRETYGATTVAGVGADGNGDGVVNAADYTVWRDNFPSAVQGPTAGSSPAPEPAATALCCLGAAGVGACRRRR